MQLILIADISMTTLRTQTARGENGVKFERPLDVKRSPTGQLNALAPEFLTVSIECGVIAVCGLLQCHGLLATECLVAASHLFLLFRR